MARDYSKPSEAANLRIAGATRLHCDQPYLDEEEAKIHERDMARGKVDDSQCERFNKELRRGGS